MVDITRDEVWQAIASTNFMVVGMTTASGASRTAGLMHHVHDGRIWFTTNAGMWKARHIAANPEVSVTVPVAKKVPLMPWIKVPAATITFTGVAEIVPAAELAPDVSHALLHGLDVTDDGPHGALIGVAVRPTGHFVTYGIGVSAAGMRNPEHAAGRVAAASAPAKAAPVAAAA
ncbi:pyridoxamine 5'-phosphate oxidase family protein [Agromyces sp. LHK192]|uniref:pyridoxamine 5'-phosphate oxidase family protein n=1 Tax=Agromyces sp. LHK192 TaxID=2498704 RepID=UPI000FD8F8FA|nr:pyridoxamine 5'-phosphate oxidase family protein [Agromyces sp. LHK192]